MAWKTGDFVIDILNEVEDYISDNSSDEEVPGTIEVLDSIISQLKRIKVDLVASTSK